MSEQTLPLDLGPAEPPILLPDEKEPGSYTVRLTRLNNRTIANGTHPATRYPLRQPVGEETCGSCKFSEGVGGHAKTYWKCRLVYHTFGPKTDIRLRWPACSQWESQEGD